MNYEIGLMASLIEPGRTETLLLRLRPELFMTLDFLGSILPLKSTDLDTACIFLWKESLLSSSYTLLLECTVGELVV